MAVPGPVPFLAALEAGVAIILGAARAATGAAISTSDVLLLLPTGAVPRSAFTGGRLGATLAGLPVLETGAPLLLSEQQLATRSSRRRIIILVAALNGAQTASHFLNRHRREISELFN